MALEFTPIDLGRRDAYWDLLNRCPQPASDYSLVNLFAWAETYGLEWAWENDLVWLRQSKPDRAYWAPIGDWSGIDWPQRFKHAAPEPLRFTRLPGMLCDHWRSAGEPALVFAEERGNWDYLYRVQELVTLSGNRLHKKKNLLNQFRKTYTYTYQALDTSLLTIAIQMQDSWCGWRDCESSQTLEAENRAISRVFDNWAVFQHILGGAILVDGKMAAFTVGEQLTREMLVIHFEKGLTDYKGVYQAINQMFLAAHPEFEWVNREQDLDEPGLRKAKLSYQPAGFIEKFSASWR